MQTQPKELIKIRTYRFQHGILHLEKGTAEGMTDQELAEYYSDQGPLLEAFDDEMDAEAFFDLPDLRDL